MSAIGGWTPVATHALAAALAVMGATPPADAGRAGLDIVHTGVGFSQGKR
jgi:hypothetical protein